MISVLSMSPAIDKRLEFVDFTVGATNRVQSIKEEAAGKAVDVALSAVLLGEEAICIGALPKGGEAILRRLETDGVHCDFLDAPGNIRVNQKLYDRNTGIITEVNESAPEMPEALLQAIQDKAVVYATLSDFLVLTGSLPQFCPKDFYARVIRRIREVAPDCRCILDAEGEALSLGMAEKPWLIKPNAFEYGLLAYRTLPQISDKLHFARELVNEGVENIIISLGAEGALAVAQSQAFIAQGIAAKTTTTTGAGDAMIAGIMHGYREKHTLWEALRCGVAAATARCANAGKEYLDVELYKTFYHRVVITEA